MLTQVEMDAFTAGYNDRFDGRPNNPGSRKGSARRLYCSGYVQACNDIVVFKRTDREANLRRALGA